MSEYKPMVIELEATKTRPYIVIDGVSYEYVDFDDLSVNASRDFNQRWKKIQALEQSERELSDAEVEEYDAGLNWLVSTAVPLLPESTTLRLRRSMKVDLLWDFLGKTQKATVQQMALAVMIAELQKRSQSSNGTTAGQLPTGTQSQSRSSRRS